MMERIAMTLGMGQKDNRVGGGDSFVDRLSCSYTVLLLGVFAFGITTKQWLGDVPISCWCPAHFESSHVDFTNKVCWTQDTYYLPSSEHYIPKSRRGKAYISYYQWVALVLVCQACLFYLPRSIWHLLNKKSGIAVATVTDAAIECQKSLDGETREKVMRYMVKHLGKFLLDLNRKHLISGKIKGLIWQFYGSYLFFTYVLIKFIYLLNVVGQLFWINRFLNTDFHLYGFKVLGKMLQGESWSTSDRFPRVTLCDFSIRMVGNIHNYTVQCSLPMNLFNEKIYIFIWFWFVFVALATIGSIIAWFSQSIYPPQQVKYVKSRLVAMDKIKHKSERKDVSKFVRTFLRSDGMFLVRLVAKNSSDMIAAQMLCGLWDQYRENKEKIEKIEKLDCRSEISKKSDHKSLISDLDSTESSEDIELK